ncbi:natriuretic peptides B [Tupaia chinensis]|uniref:natriuretic peptides B n=1 Tax=Tupaia chinensis TaxID=246437 RepID=UPI000FFC6AEA|nr:natriuretic peptides B [Tupaia chinensis]
MDPHMILPRALLLLLFLHLSPLGCRSHPLSSPISASELSGVQELLDLLQDKVSKMQAERMVRESLERSRSLAEPREGQEAGPASVLGSREGVLQALRGLRSPKMMRNSSCFGRRLDRIGSLSGLGCNVSPKCLEPQRQHHRGNDNAQFTDEKTEAQGDGRSQRFKHQDWLQTGECYLQVLRRH